MKRYLALAFLLLIPFAYYAFLRNDLLYYDSYHFACLACGCDIARSEAPLAFVFSLLPCNLIVFKVLLYACALASILILEKTQRYAGFFAFLVPAFLLEFFRFENDTLAYPFLFAATYFFLKSYKKPVNFVRYQLFSVLFILLACGFWGGSLFMPFILSAGQLAMPMWILSGIFALLFGGQMFGWFFSSFDTTIVENMPFINLPFLFPALLLAPLGWKRSWHNPAWYALLLALIKPKLVVFSLIFLPIGIAQLVEKYPRTKAALLIPAVAIALASFMPLLHYPPQQEAHSAIDYALQIAPDKQVSNDWDIGYIVKWHGGKTDSFGNPLKQKEYHGVAVSKYDLNCELPQCCLLLKRFKSYAVWWCK